MEKSALESYNIRKNSVMTLLWFVMEMKIKCYGTRYEMLWKVITEWQKVCWKVITFQINKGF